MLKNLFSNYCFECINIVAQQIQRSFRIDWLPNNKSARLRAAEERLWLRLLLQLCTSGYVYICLKTAKK